MTQNNRKNRVAEMLEFAGSTIVKFKEFIGIHGKYKNAVICIFEGQDERYYSIRLDSHIGQGKWKGINAEGRDKVIAIEKVLRRHPTYSTSNYLCFIDHDYQDWYVNENPSRIYITPCYSIENLYVTESCFEKVLNSEFGIYEFNEFNEDFIKCKKMFKDRLDEFNSAIFTFNCWAKAHRIMEYRGSTTLKLNLRNIQFNSLVEVTLTEVKTIYDQSNPLTVFLDCQNLCLCPDAMNDAHISFDDSKIGTHFRGKQQLEFMKSILLKLKFDRTSKTPNFFSKKGAVALMISGNCISELSQYADTPPCLSKFLNDAKLTLAA